MTPSPPMPKFLEIGVDKIGENGLSTQFGGPFNLPIAELGGLLRGQNRRRGVAVVHEDKVIAEALVLPKPERDGSARCGNRQ